MKHEILTNYIDILHRTWEIYHASQALHLSKQHRAALEIGILEAEGKYKAATIELQQELDLNKPAYSTTENHKIDFLVKHMMLPEPLQIQADQTNILEKAQIIRRRKKIMKGVTWTAENESKREHLSTMLINGLYEHVNQLKNKIIKDFEPKKINTKGANNEKTALYYALELHYSKNKPINNNQIQQAFENETMPVTIKSIQTKNNELIEDRYKFNTTKRNNPLAFKKAYELLMENFGNTKIFDKVKIHYEELKIAYPRIFD